MPPSVQLTYFNLKDIGEPIRLLLAYGGIEFKDVRVSDEEWPQMKDSFPFGQSPLYEEHGKKITQSVAICRYLSKKVGLNGVTDWENLEIDSIVDTINDLQLKILRFQLEENEDTKESLKKSVLEETLPYYFIRLENIARKNYEHLALAKLTWADVFFAGCFFDLHQTFGDNIWNEYPYLRTIKNNIYEIPAIEDRTSNVNSE